MYYSAKNNGFYPTLNYQYLPFDLIEITDEYHEELLTGQSNGMLIASDEKGYPFLIPPLPLSIDELRECMVLTRLDAKALLIEMGRYTEINNEIMAMPDCLLKLKWTEAELFKRTDKDLESYLKNLGMTDEEIDDLFCKKK